MLLLQRCHAGIDLGVSRRSSPTGRNHDGSNSFIEFDDPSAPGYSY